MLFDESPQLRGIAADQRVGRELRNSVIASFSLWLRMAAGSSKTRAPA
jgi:hypothetical protein